MIDAFKYRKFYTVAIPQRSFIQLWNHAISTLFLCVHFAIVHTHTQTHSTCSTLFNFSIAFFLNQILKENWKLGSISPSCLQRWQKKGIMLMQSTCQRPSSLYSNKSDENRPLRKWYIYFPCPWRSHTKQVHELLAQHIQTYIQSSMARADTQYLTHFFFFFAYCEIELLRRSYMPMMRAWIGHFRENCVFQLEFVYHQQHEWHLQKTESLGIVSSMPCPPYI